MDLVHSSVEVTRNSEHFWRECLLEDSKGEILVLYFLLNRMNVSANSGTATLLEKKILCFSLLVPHFSFIQLFTLNKKK
jgi:hypothetical protein